MVHRGSYWPPSASGPLNLFVSFDKGMLRILRPSEFAISEGPMSFIFTKVQRNDIGPRPPHAPIYTSSQHRGGGEWIAIVDEDEIEQEAVPGCRSYRHGDPSPPPPRQRYAGCSYRCSSAKSISNWSARHSGVYQAHTAGAWGNPKSFSGLVERKN
jgi:hypothetical protein